MSVWIEHGRGSWVLLYGYYETRGTIRKIGPMVSGQGPVIDDDVNLTRGQHGPEIKNTEVEFLVDGSRSAISACGLAFCKN
jgi:hypothetical protein